MCDTRDDYSFQNQLLVERLNVTHYRKMLAIEMQQGDDRAAKLKAELLESKVQVLDHRTQVIQLTMLLDQAGELKARMQRMELSAQGRQSRRTHDQAARTSVVSPPEGDLLGRSRRNSSPSSTESLSSPGVAEGQPISREADGRESR